MTKMPVKIDGYFFMKILASLKNFAQYHKICIYKLFPSKCGYVLAQLCLIGTQLADSFAANAPIIHLHLINDNHRGGGIFVQHVLQQFGDTCYQLRFLGRRGGFVAACNFDIDIGHGTSFCML